MWSYLLGEVDKTMGLVPSPKFMRFNTKSPKFLDAKEEQKEEVYDVWSDFSGC